MVCYNEHRVNMKHKENYNGFNQLFQGGEAGIRSVVAHNFHKNVGRVQEGGGKYASVWITNSTI